jgi:hypothetical protein
MLPGRSWVVTSPMISDNFNLDLSKTMKLIITMKTIKTLAPLLAIFILSCGPQMSRTDIINETFPETQSEIKLLVDNILKDGAEKNLEALDDYHLNSPKFTRVDNNGILSYDEGKKLEENFYGNSDILSYKIHNQTVDVFGDVAISSFYLDMTAIVNSDTLDLKSELS